MALRDTANLSESTLTTMEGHIGGAYSNHILSRSYGHAKFLLHYSNWLLCQSQISMETRRRLELHLAVSTAVIGGR
jgi:hypothetical protein